MFIQPVPEPETSQSRLDEFEQKYGIESSEFYSLYYQGMDPIGDRFVADLWAFEYEINVRARELREDDGQTSPHNADRYAASGAA